MMKLVITVKDQDIELSMAEAEALFKELGTIFNKREHKFTIPDGPHKRELMPAVGKFQYPTPDVEPYGSFKITC